MSGQDQSRGDEGDSGTWEKFRKRNVMDDLLPETAQNLDKPQETGDATAVIISNVEFLASYCWTDEKTPTIIVPGSPRIWSNPKLPLTVSADSGESFIDQNSHRLPKHPMLPIFVAIDTMGADASRKPPKWTSVDVITDRNNLLKLAGWADSSCSSSRSKKDFRIDLQWVGPSTILLQRWEERSCVWSNGNTGFGGSFEEASSYAAPGCEDAALAGSSRIISYDFSGLKLVVRFDVDACYAPEPNVTSPSTNGQTAEDLADALASLNVTPSLPCPSTYPDGPAVVRGGSEVPQASLIKVKTRVHTSSGGFPGAPEYLQLFFGQTPTILVGIHNKGTFNNVKERKLESPEFAYSAQKVQPGLRKLRRLLEEIQKIVLEKGKGAKLSLVCKKGVLQIMERSGDQVLLPDSILERFVA